MRKNYHDKRLVVRKNYYILLIHEKMWTISCSLPKVC